MQKNTFWKKIFCVCSSEDGSDQSRPYSKSIQQQQVQHYAQKGSISRSNSSIYVIRPDVQIANSNISFQIKTVNESKNTQLELVADNTQQMCFLVKKIIHSITINEKQKNQYKNYFEVVGDKKILIDNKVKLSPIQLSKHIAEKLKPFKKILEVNSQFGQQSQQFLKQGVKLISLSSSLQQATMMHHNLSELFSSSFLQENLDLIIADFSHPRTLNLMNFEVDAVFLNLAHFYQKMQHSIYQQLMNSFKISRNVIILLENSKIDFLLNIMTKITLEHPEIYTSLALTKEEIIINLNQEFVVVYIGQCANLSRHQLIEALHEVIYEQGKFYRKYELKNIITPILHDLVEKIGCIKLMKFFLEALYHKKENDDICQSFFLQLERAKLISTEILDEYVSKYPIVSQNTSPERKPKQHNTNQNQQQTFSFSYDIKGDVTHVTDFILDGGTYFSTTCPTGDQQ